MSDFQITELARRLENIIRIGVIHDLNEQAARVRVKSGDNITTWLPWLTSRAGNDRSWWAPDIGEQVVILAPSGNLSSAIVLLSIYQDSNPAPANSKDKHRVVYSDGTSIEYDRASNHLTVSCQGDVTITAQGAVTVNSDQIKLGNGVGAKVARVGDMVQVGHGSSAGQHPIISGSNIVESA